jgi:hypothetical protein
MAKAERRRPESVRRFFREHGYPDLDDTLTREGLWLLEMQRHALLMYASCGWFFDEISGLETTQCLRYAARAIQLARHFGADFEEEFLRRLEQAKSNLPQYRNGRGVWEMRVRPWQIDLDRVLAHQAISLLYRPRQTQARVYCYDLEALDQEVYSRGSNQVGLREVQENQVPLFEGMLSAKTLTPIAVAKQEAGSNNNNKQEAAEIKGVRLVSSETITTQVFADLNVVEAQLMRAVKALDANKADDADKALAAAQVRGVEFRYNKEDTPLAQARDAMWLAKRSLEENNAAQAQANLSVARQSLQLYREIAPKERLKEVDQMLKKADELDAKLRQETAQQPASNSERMQQSNAATRWWERINQWFRRR